MSGITFIFLEITLFIERENQCQGRNKLKIKKMETKRHIGNKNVKKITDKRWNLILILR